jgi:probable pyridine nucleotide-disulfide oxidoreductase
VKNITFVVDSKVGAIENLNRGMVVFYKTGDTDHAEAYGNAPLLAIEKNRTQRD